MKEYWLYTDGYPGDKDWEEWGIYEFEYYEDPEERGVDNAEITGVIINRSARMKISSYDEIWEDAITDDPKRILKFLFDQRFY